jgi:DNA polymerase III subunit delta'
MPFSSIVGHGRLLSLLSAAVARGTLPPSLLFSGPAGVGKRAAAGALAQALNCERAAEPGASAVGGSLALDGCGACASCRRIARNVHPDVIVVEPGDTGSIKVEQIRDVLGRSAYRPFEGRRRVVIVDEADAMVEEAQNALLKTLEEPPPASVFVLVTAAPDALLPTVRSRCPRLRFGPLTAGEVASVLMRDHDFTEADARAAAADSDGSVGAALAARSVDAAEARGLAWDLLERAARVADPARRLESARSLTPKKGSSAAEREHLAACLRVLASLLRDLGVLALQGDVRTLANPDLQPRLEGLAGAFDGRRSARAFAAVDRALSALGRNASPKVVANWLALQL